jgi:repressor LexA
MFESVFTVAQPPPEISPVERTVLRALVEAIRLHGNPSMMEIAELAGFSHASTAWLHLRRLQAKGFVAITPGRARGIRLLREE